MRINKYRAQLAHMRLYACRLKRKPRYRPRLVHGVETLRREYEKHAKRLSPVMLEYLKYNPHARLYPY